VNISRTITNFEKNPQEIQWFVSIPPEIVIPAGAFPDWQRLPHRGAGEAPQTSK
jgi:hypothetical protein